MCVRGTSNSGLQAEYGKWDQRGFRHIQKKKVDSVVPKGFSRGSWEIFLSGKENSDTRDLEKVIGGLRISLHKAQREL